MTAGLTQQLRDAADSGRFDALDMDLLREAAEQLAAKDAVLDAVMTAVRTYGDRGSIIAAEGALKEATT